MSRSDRYAVTQSQSHKVDEGLVLEKTEADEDPAAVFDAEASDGEGAPAPSPGHHAFVVALREKGRIVKLNVGGTLFCTSRDTLGKDPQSMLAVLVSTDVPTEKDDTGALFIDRDGTHFRYILNFLRDGAVELPDDTHILMQLLAEAQYYHVVDLVQMIRTKMRTIKRGVLPRATLLQILHSSLPIQLPLTCLAGLNLSHLDFSGANLIGADLTNTNLTHANLKGAKLSRACLKEAILISAEFASAKCDHCNFSKADIRHATFIQADLKNAIMSEAVMTRSILQDTILKGVVWTGATLSKIVLVGADLRDANLEAVDLQGANLEGAQLTNANLKSANLRGANLYNSKLRNANLTDAVMRETNVQLADMEGAIGV